MDLLKRFATMTTASLTTANQLENSIKNLPTNSLTTKYEEKPVHSTTLVWKLMLKKDRYLLFGCSDNQNQIIRFTHRITPKRVTSL